MVFLELRRDSHNKWRSELCTGTVGAEEGKPEGWKMVRESFLERVTPEMNYKE